MIIYFDFVDRLLNLYQRGMEKFLQEDISYISNEQIDNAFWAVKNNRNATKKQIQKYFRELKFFSNSAFSFIDTHNEKLFNKNTKVLLEVVRMWQHLRLKTEKQNQFLGDMFEFFLDNSIKQTNGQFFTPLAICKFIVSALPLQKIVEKKEEPIKVMDFACGSGHFLNEYAYQIKPIVEKMEKKIEDYYANIIGIEKEYRLAKIAKIAAFMYGQEEIQIISTDALAQNENIKEENFDVIVANPPFSVDGFLNTLSDEDKKKYQLTKVASIDTDTIQCFFIERLKQVIAPAGVVGIILPSSILSDAKNIYTTTREILLKYFDFISIVEMGGGTFGKTGTNTVILFLRRKNKKPEVTEHYNNRVKDFFEGDTEINKEKYKDDDLLKDYCQYIKIPYEKYIGLLEDAKGIDNLLEYDIFKDYQQNFAKSTEIKNLKKKVYI